jgi:hypothetical protein
MKLFHQCGLEKRVGLLNPLITAIVKEKAQKDLKVYSSERIF